VKIPAYAKLNLYLDICGLREDGYHLIDTEMQEIDLADMVTVKITEHDDICITCDNPVIPTDNRNIAYRAAEAFLAKSGLGFGVQIHIEKKIPLMAGLGGSSTNAAAVLKALSRLNGNLFDTAALCEIGSALGADVAFAIIGGRARCRGIGEMITPLPALPKQYYVIAQPDFYCNTNQAYAAYDKRENFCKDKYANVFQALYADERVDNLCSVLTESGASTASMTGSGSAVFGVFADSQTAEFARERINAPFKCVAQNI
jgi:4-diphosphocytidyl-2-C-methyl-D-erythritol kinase